MPAHRQKGSGQALYFCPCWLCPWWSFTRTKDIPSGHCRSLSMNSCLWDVDDGSGGNQWVLFPLHPWSGGDLHPGAWFPAEMPMDLPRLHKQAASQLGSLEVSGHSGRVGFFCRSLGKNRE